MKKIRFIIVGSGWRSLFYARIAKALPEVFELGAMLCRTAEKAAKIAGEHHIHTTTSIEECKAYNPDFAVVAVNKASIADVSMEWMNYGFTVLCETPASLNMDTLDKLWSMHLEGKRLVVAEQYTAYPTYKSMLDILNSGIIGKPDCINISLAHDYHGTSLMRAFLQQNGTEQFTISAKEYFFNTVETLTRHNDFKDGRIALKRRVVATFTFDNGQIGWFDFDSEQYRSPIRKNHIKVQGMKGELLDNTIYFLDENYTAQQGTFCKKTIPSEIFRNNPDPTSQFETSEITFSRTDLGSKVVYAPEFGLCGLNEDETAIAHLMKQTAEYTWASKTSDETAIYLCKKMEFLLRNALQDSYMSILLQKAIDARAVVESEVKEWNKI